MRFLSVVAAASLIAACAGAPSSRYPSHVLHEKRDGEPHQWGKRDRAAAHEALPIRIGLRQRNLEHAERFISEISDPRSPNFGKSLCISASILSVADNYIWVGKHWTAEQIANTFAPHQETKDYVTRWLTDSGIDRSRISFSTGA